jgi:hypothetical protein
MLLLRSAVSFALLLTLAGGFALLGRENAIAASAAWWLWFVAITNVVCIALMAKFGRGEGMRLRDIYFANRSSWKGDITWTVLAFAVTAILALPPGMWLANALWGNVNYPNDMLFQALPLAAVYPLFLLMPTTHALAELPTYWGYVAPRLRASGMNRWMVIGLVGAMLSIQHMFFAFQLDWRYDLWLAVKFLPFALWTGVVVDRRPTTLPYLMGAHFVLDAVLPSYVLMVSNGESLS